MTEEGCGMEKTTTEELKEVLNVTEWKEIKTTEQFSNLVSFMYTLDEKNNCEILSSIEKLELLVESFFYESIDTIIDYEPSIMVALVDMNSHLISLLAEGDESISIKKVAHELMVFSKWIMVDSKVKYIKADKEYIISIFAALTMIRGILEKEDKAEIEINLLSERRDTLLKDLKDLVEFGIDFGSEDNYASNGSFDENGHHDDFDEDDYDDDDYYLN